MFVLPSRHSNPIHSKELREFVDLQMEVFSEKPDFGTVEIRGLKKDALTDQSHQFRRTRDGNYLLAAIATRPDINVGQVNVVQPTLKEMVVCFLEDKMFIATGWAFFRLIQVRLLKKWSLPKPHGR